MRGRTLGVAAAALALALGATPPVLADAGGSPPATVLMAAPDGEGTACTAGQPCGLLEAQARSRQLVPHMTSDIDIVLEDGTYDLANSLQLTTADSGTTGFNVVYEAAPGARPVLSGGQTITGWQLEPGTANVWEAPIDFDTRQLYIDGQSVPLAQGLPSRTGLLQTPTGFLATSTVMDSWPHPTNIARRCSRAATGPGPRPRATSPLSRATSSPWPSPAGRTFTSAGSGCRSWPGSTTPWAASAACRRSPNRPTWKMPPRS